MPEGVTSVSVVAVGGGGDGTATGIGAGAGGGLVYANNINVISGNIYSVVVGNKALSTNIPGGTSSFGGIIGAYGGGSILGDRAMEGGTGYGGVIGQG